MTVGGSEEGGVIDGCEEIVNFLVIYFGVGEPDRVLMVSIEFERGGVSIGFCGEGVVESVCEGELVGEVGRRRGSW